MAAWFVAALPYLPDVIKMAKPLFTRKPQEKTADVFAQQIVELQDAATRNAEAIEKLTNEMQKTIETLKLGAESLTRDLRIARITSTVAITVSVLSFLVAAYALAN